MVGGVLQCVLKCVAVVQVDVDGCSNEDVSACLAVSDSARCSVFCSMGENATECPPVRVRGIHTDMTREKESTQTRIGRQRDRVRGEEGGGRERDKGRERWVDAYG